MDAGYAIAITMVDEDSRPLVDLLVAEVARREPETPVHQFAAQWPGVRE